MNMELADKYPGSKEMPLIEKINRTLREIGSESRWKRPPEAIRGCEVLNDRTLVMVDDTQDVLEAFAPDLLVATNGKTSFVQYQGQNQEELLQEILACHPNTVLLDYHLSEELDGATIAAALRGSGFSGEIIGFSSDTKIVEEFKRAGAMGCIDKDAGRPERSVKDLVHLISQESKSSHSA